MFYFLNMRTIHRTISRQISMYIIPSGMDIHGDVSDKNNLKFICKILYAKVPTRIANDCIIFNNDV